MSRKKPPLITLPEGQIVWYGGPVERWKVTFRVFGEDLDPDHVSAMLGCVPSTAQARGNPFPRKGRWLLEIDSRDYEENAKIEHGIRILRERLPTDNALWISLTSNYAVDIFCGVSLGSSNQGFGISTEVSRWLSDRNLKIEFDIYGSGQGLELE